MNDFSMKNVLKKNIMTIALFVVYFLFVGLAFSVQVCSCACLPVVISTFQSVQ